MEYWWNDTHGLTEILKEKEYQNHFLLKKFHKNWLETESGPP